MSSIHNTPGQNVEDMLICVSDAREGAESIVAAAAAFASGAQPEELKDLIARLMEVS